MKKTNYLQKLFFINALSLSIICAAHADNYHNPGEILAQIHQQKNVGQGIYENFCAVCHDPEPVIPLGAPRKGNKADWKKRRQQTWPQMLKRIDEGINQMPPRGGCFECTDQDLKAATDYMMPGK